MTAPPSPDARAGTRTDPEPRSLRSIRRSRDGRRVGVALLALFVLAGATGVFGTRTGTVSAEGAGYTLTVTYPRVSRPGHAVEYAVRVHRPGGFDGPVTLRFGGEYFQIFDENAFDPAAIKETSTGPDEFREFERPPGEVFALDVDTRVEPSRQTGSRGDVAVVEDGRDVVVVAYRTWLAP